MHQEGHITPDFKNYYKKLKQNIKEENDKGRQFIDNKSHKVNEEQTFIKLDDSELFDDKNKDIIQKILHKLQICTDNKCNNPRCKNILFLYTNKKVGSTCLWGSINLYLSNIFRTFHYHNIGDLERDGVYDISINQLITILKKYNKNIIVIDIYRPIFDICVSNYFNELSLHFQRDFSIYPEFENKDTIIHRFLNLFNHYYYKHEVDYYKDVYNIKQFESFDFKKKHLFYQDGSVKYIKLRLCDSLEWNKILKPYLGYEFKIIKHNETKNKPWGKYYDFFKNNFFITTLFLDKIKNDKQFKFYFSQEEQTEYLKQFENKIKDDANYGFVERELIFYYNIIKRNETFEILSHLSLESNTPIATNCQCEFCNKSKLNLLKKQYFKNNPAHNNNNNNNNLNNFNIKKINFYN